MCTGIEIAALAGLGGAIAGKALTPQPPDLSSTMKTPQKPPPTQPSKAPDRNAVQGASMYPTMAGGTLAGNSSTFLTGPGGVPSSSLSVGRNTLLGQ